MTPRARWVVIAIALGVLAAGLITTLMVVGSTFLD